MTAENIIDNRKTKLKLLAIYILSVAIIVFIISWLRNDATGHVISDTNASLVKDGSEELVKADELLHQKLDALNKLYSNVVWQPSITQDNRDAIQLAESSFSTSLDSLEKKGVALTTKLTRQKWEALIASFKNNYYSRSALYAGYANLKNNAASQGKDNQHGAETVQLKNILEEKDKAIASLQAQLSNAPTAVNKNSNDNEWKGKYAQLKNQYDKLDRENNQFKNSYRTVIADNQRLLSQLQAKRQ